MEFSGGDRFAAQFRSSARRLCAELQSTRCAGHCSDHRQLSRLLPTYWLARKGAGAFDKTRELQESNSKAARLLRRFGQPSLLFSWLPIIGDALVALAGGVKMDFKMFSLWTVIGKLLRYAAVAWAASALGF
jgi:hypothetical protein